MQAMTGRKVSSNEVVGALYSGVRFNRHSHIGWGIMSHETMIFCAHHGGVFEDVVSR